MGDPPERRRLEWGYLGRVGYRDAVALQESRRELLRSGGSESLLLLEHPHVYTLGRSAARSDLIAGDQWLASMGIEVAECDRGGQVTYHGPGQLVGYPIINLDPDRRDLRLYVGDLQRVLVATLARFGVEARARTEQPWIGVWVGECKIASLGVHVSRWLTTHGFALNVSTDLSYFAGIVPCGLPDVQLCSIETVTGTRPALSEVAEVCAAILAETFGREPAPAAWPTAS